MYRDEREWLGWSHTMSDSEPMSGPPAKWMTRQGWRDFPGQEFHHGLIPQGGWGEAIPDAIKNQLWNLMGMSQPEHTALHQADGAERVWNGTPNWAKVGGADAVGKAANLAGRNCSCE